MAALTCRDQTWRALCGLSEKEGCFRICQLQRIAASTRYEFDAGIELAFIGLKAHCQIGVERTGNMWCTIPRQQTATGNQDDETGDCEQVRSAHGCIPLPMPVKQISGFGTSRFRGTCRQRHRGGRASVSRGLSTDPDSHDRRNVRLVKDQRWDVDTESGIALVRVPKRRLFGPRAAAHYLGIHEGTLKKITDRSITRQDDEYHARLCSRGS